MTYDEWHLLWLRKAVAAAVIVDPQSDVSKETIVVHVKSIRGAVHAPKHVHVVAELPLTTLGKVDKVKVRNILVDKNRR